MWTSLDTPWSASHSDFYDNCGYVGVSVKEIYVFLLASCRTVAKLLNFSKSQFTYLPNGDKNVIYLTGR